MADKDRRDELVARMKPLGGIAEAWVGRLQAGECPMCGGAINEADFRDELSRKEFALSHMCQKCQDEIFGSLGPL